jgi:hypothetical protein
MSSGARVESIDSIKEFRVYLAKFQETAGRALGDADSDLNKMQTWLEGEQQTYWSGQIRKRQEALVKAEEALRHKKLYKDSSGSTQSGVEEAKEVAKCKKNLADAQQKLANVKGWIRRLQKEVTLYRGGVGRFAGTVSGGVPSAIAQLGNMIEMLEKYVGMGPASLTGEVGEPAVAGAFGGTGAGGMKRAVEEAPKPAAEAEAAPIDPAAIRASAPLPQALAAAPPRAESALAFAAGGITLQQLETVVVLAGNGSIPPDDQTIAIQEAVLSSPRIFLLNHSSDPSTSAWRLGAVDATGPGDYNTITVAQLRAARPDLVELLRLPAGSLVVVGNEGVEAVFDQNNQNLFKDTQPKEPNGNA